MPSGKEKGLLYFTHTSLSVSFIAPEVISFLIPSAIIHPSKFLVGTQGGQFDEVVV